MEAGAQRNREKDSRRRRSGRRVLARFALDALNINVLALLGAALGGALAGIAGTALHAQSLPDAPSALLASQTASQPPAPATPKQPASPVPAQTTASTAKPPAQTPARSVAPQPPPSLSLPRCPHQGLTGILLFLPGKTYGPCEEENQLQYIVDPAPIRPLTPSQKGMLAVRGVLDPFNLVTIAGFSGITIAANSHTVYGPGFEGFGMLAGYSLAGDIQDAFISGYGIPVLTHEDPRYHRLPGKPFSRRLEHAIVHTFVTQHDNGSLMPNYSTLLGYPINAEISNLYVPGLRTSVPATAERVAVSIGTDPVGAIVAEFLPDVARHIHIHIIFMQQILNRVAIGSYTTPQ